MFKSQTLIVAEQLLKEKEVSRNWALRKGITRLGAIIQVLIANGLEFKRPYFNIFGEEIMRGFFVKTKNGGKDYFYYLIKAPKKIKRV